jgi:hypothetical protein
MGLSLCHLTRLLDEFGVVPPSDIALECQGELGYDCPISSALLRGELVS